MYIQIENKRTNISTDVVTNNDSKLSVINVHDDIQETLSLLNILQRHTSENKWTLLLAPDAVPSKSLLESLSIDHNKLLVIRQRHLINLEYVINSALENGNFGAVISWTNMLDEVTLSQLSAKQAKFNGHFYHFSCTKNKAASTTF